MPRQPRLDVPGSLNHVMGRGVLRTKIFRSKTDHDDFLERLGELCEDGALKVYAWALMPNHFHLLVRTAKQPLSSSMRKLLTGYVVNFNHRHKRSGRLFQNRYKSIVCEDDPYLLELTRYIHLNPLRKRAISTMGKLKRYQWTGHSVIMGSVIRPWQDTNTVLGYFGKRKKKAIERYEAFVREGIPKGRRPELVGGGLIRSLGGWSEVLSHRRQEIRVASDERVLGSNDFIEGLLAEVGQNRRETLRISAKTVDLDKLAKRVAKTERVDLSAIKSASRKPQVVKARKVFCQLAIRKMGYSGAKIARFLGKTTSSANRLARAEVLEEIKKY